MKLTKLFVVLATFGATVFVSDGSVRAAQTPDSTFHVTAKVVANCTLTTRDFAFLAYDPIAGTGDTVDVTWTIRCTKNAPNLQITIGQGNNWSGADSTNGMASTTTGITDVLKYQLIRPSDGARWNNATLTIPSPSSGFADESIAIRARIASGQDPSAADYSDTVIATLNY
jgi:spore coat protein U-like protein